MSAATRATPSAPERERAAAGGGAALRLLHREARRCGLLAADDPAPDDEGTLTAAAAHAIDALLDREVHVPEPDDAACRRHHAAHPGRYSEGERVRARHILFAVTDGVDIVALGRRAEQALLDLRAEPARFAAASRELSNCPSGADGGDLGWLRREDCAPEFANELFARTEVGVLPRLVHSRHGLHVVEVLAREPGRTPPFEAVRGAAALTLRRHAHVTALRQYLRVLEGRADPDGGTGPGARTNPLVQ